MKVWLRFLSGPIAGETRAFDVAPGHTIRVGGAEDNDVQLPPPVESHHAMLRNESGALLMHNMARSRTGGLVRGEQRVERVPVLPGDIFALGRAGPQFDVFFEPDPIPQASAPPVYMAPPPPPPPPPPVAAPPLQIHMPPPGKGMTAPYAIRDPGLDIHNACGICGAALGNDVFVCYQCRRTLCTSHYEPTTGICGPCAVLRGLGGPPAPPPPPPPPAAYPAGMTAPQMPAYAPPPGGPGTGTAPQMPAFPGH